jgi:hypothetical protein
MEPNINFIHISEEKKLRNLTYCTTVKRFFLKGILPVTVTIRKDYPPPTQSLTKYADKNF